MNKYSIYPDELIKEKKSTRYIYIKIKNTFWIVNRISSLFRKRRYFMEEFAVDLNDDNTADIMIVIDWEIFDINQIINQIKKIYDVIDASDVTLKTNLINYMFFIDCNDKTCIIDGKKPNITIKTWNIYKQIYHINVKDRKSFQDFLKSKWYEYKERLTTLF